MDHPDILRIAHFSIFIHIFISSDISPSRAADQPETASPVHNKPQLRQGRSLS